MLDSWTLNFGTGVGKKTKKLEEVNSDLRVSNFTTNAYTSVVNKIVCTFLREYLYHPIRRPADEKK